MKLFAIVSGIKFTLALTPALSPRKRENRPPSHPKTCDSICRTAVRIIQHVGLLFPLPGGEGKGEGERQTFFTQLHPLKTPRNCK